MEVGPWPPHIPADAMEGVESSSIAGEEDMEKQEKREKKEKQIYGCEKRNGAKTTTRCIWNISNLMPPRNLLLNSLFYLLINLN